MRSLNKVMLIGFLGKDPETNFTPQGAKVSQLRLATSDKWTDKEGVVQEHTEWHTVIAWRSLADVVEKYARKGSRVYVEGRLNTRSYDDRDGNKRYVTEITAENILLLDGKRADSSSDDADDASHHEQSTSSDEIPF